MITYKPIEQDMVQTLISLTKGTPHAALLLFDSPAFAIGAYDEDNLIGACSGKKRTNWNHTTHTPINNTLIIVGVYVLPKYRGQGISLELADRLIEKYGDNCAEIEIEAMSTSGLRFAGGVEKRHENVVVINHATDFTDAAEQFFIMFTKPQMETEE